MKKARFTEEQIIGFLREQEAGVTTAEVCRRHGFSAATFYKWKAKYGGLGFGGQAAEDARRRERQAEAAAGGCHAGQYGAEGFAWKKMVTPAARREAAAHLRSAHQMSERRACRVVGADRSCVRYRTRRPDDAALRARLKALAAERRRFGYRRQSADLLHRPAAPPRQRQAPGPDRRTVTDVSTFLLPTNLVNITDLLRGANPV